MKDSNTTRKIRPRLDEEVAPSTVASRDLVESITEEMQKVRLVRQTANAKRESIAEKIQRNDSEVELISKQVEDFSREAQKKLEKLIVFYRANLIQAKEQRIAMLFTARSLSNELLGLCDRTLADGESILTSGKPVDPDLILKQYEHKTKHVINANKWLETGFVFNTPDLTCELPLHPVQDYSDDEDTEDGYPSAMGVFPKSAFNIAKVINKNRRFAKQEKFFVPLIFGGGGGNGQVERLEHPSAMACFSRPSSSKLDWKVALGEIWVADAIENKLMAISPLGELKTELFTAAQIAKSGVVGLSHPTGLAIDPTDPDVIYVVDHYGLHRVTIIKRSSSSLVSSEDRIHQETVYLNKFSQKHGVDTLSAGLAYDCKRKRLLMLDQVRGFRLFNVIHDRKPTEIEGVYPEPSRERLTCGYGVVFLSNGDFVVSDNEANVLCLFNGTTGGFIGHLGGEDEKLLSKPTHLVADQFDNVFVVDMNGIHVYCAPHYLRRTTLVFAEHVTCLTLSQDGALYYGLSHGPVKLLSRHLTSF